MTDLSILIPSRNEMFLKQTIDSVLANMRGDTEIISVLDGAWASPPIPDHDRVKLIYHSQPVGQRAAVNEAARVSTAKYIMKLDAHCSVAGGFDVTLMESMQDDWTVVPVMRNLHAFNWICGKCGDTRYQGPTPTDCPKCDNTTDFTKDIVWIAKPRPQSRSFCFDPEPHFQYFGRYNRRPEGKGDLTETMSLQGSCFMMVRERFLDLNICDESFGSWGSQGIEVACKSWLSGGRVLVNHKTWYAHMFRTQGGDFGFPYPQSIKEIEKAKQRARYLFFEGHWEKQVKPLSWLVEKFWPVEHWTDKDLHDLKVLEADNRRIPSPAPTKGIVYYTDNRIDPCINQAVQSRLCAMGKEIVSVSLAPIEFGHNITLPMERGYLTMFRQILAGLEASTADIIFLCEHDVIYHPSHFDFIPPKKDVYYYNQNCWKVDYETGRALFYYAKQTSGLCAYRDLLIEHYRKRISIVEQSGYNRRIGFEPGSHNRQERIDDYKAESWMSAVPNIDIRHNNNLTPSRWKREQFRDQRYTRGWTESGVIPGWGNAKELMERIKTGGTL